MLRRSARDLEVYKRVGYLDIRLEKVERLELDDVIKAYSIATITIV